MRIRTYLTKMMRADLGEAISSQFEDWTRGESMDELNSNAMHRALEWLEEHAPDLEEILADDAFNQVDEWAAALEQELEVA